MEKHRPTYAELERAFARLEAQRLTGEIDSDAYRNALNALRIKDDEGHTWMLQEQTGRWHVWRDGVWEAGTPPGRAKEEPFAPPPPTLEEASQPGIARSATDVLASETPDGASPPLTAIPQATPAPTPGMYTPPTTVPPPPASSPPTTPGVTPYSPPTYAPPPAYAPAPVATYPVPPAAASPAPVASVPAAVPAHPPGGRAAKRAARREARGVAASYRPGCIKITWSILTWEILWGALGWLAYDTLGQRYPWILIPVGLVALLFMVLYLRRFRQPAIEGAL